MQRLKRSIGFTLIELMIVVAVIAILAAVAIPKFGEMAIKSKEASIKGQLGQIRSALSIYFSDMGENPGDIDALIIGRKYLSEFPLVSVPMNSRGNPGHESVSGTVNFTACGPSTNFDDVTAGNVWGYASPLVGCEGIVHVNCTHTDMTGTQWTSF